MRMRLRGGSMNCLPLTFFIKHPGHPKTSGIQITVAYRHLFKPPLIQFACAVNRGRHELVYDQCRISGKITELFTELFPQGSETRSGYRNRSNTLILLRNELKNSS